MAETLIAQALLGAKVEALRRWGLYDICFRNAGVGLMFYTGPDDFSGNWRRHLALQRYYPTFTEAVEAEYERAMADDREEDR